MTGSGSDWGADITSHMKLGVPKSTPPIFSVIGRLFNGGASQRRRLLPTINLPSISLSSAGSFHVFTTAAWQPLPDSLPGLVFPAIDGRTRFDSAGFALAVHSASAGSVEVVPGALSLLGWSVSLWAETSSRNINLNVLHRRHPRHFTRTQVVCPSALLTAMLLSLATMW